LGRAFWPFVTGTTEDYADFDSRVLFTVQHSLDAILRWVETCPFCGTNYCQYSCPKSPTACHTLAVDL